MAEFVAGHAATIPPAGEGHAPPGFAAAALFAVAPAFLADPRVAPYCRSLLHAEQAFTWQRPLAVGEVLEVRGRVGAVRSRGPLHLVSFEVAAAGAGGAWMEGVSSFVLSAEAAGESPEEAEPPLDERAACDAGRPVPAARRPASPFRRCAAR